MRTKAYDTFFSIVFINIFAKCMQDGSIYFYNQ